MPVQYFATMGIESIVGVDPATKVLELAKARAPDFDTDIRFIQASFSNVAEKIGDRFDLVCSLGNSISHLLKYDELELTLKNFRSLLSARGIILIQCLNWERRLARQERFFPPKTHLSADSEKLFFRFFDFGDELVTMNLVVFQRKTSPTQSWSNRVITTKLRPWRRDVICMALEDAGLILVEEYGGTDLSAFNIEQSSDYIFIARKA